MTRRDLISTSFHDLNRAVFALYGSVDYLVADLLGPTLEATELLLSPKLLLEFAEKTQRSRQREIGYRFAIKAEKKNMDSKDLLTSDLLSDNLPTTKTKLLFRVNAANVLQSREIPLPKYFDGVFAEGQTGAEVSALLQEWNGSNKTRMCFIHDVRDVMSVDTFGCDVKIGPQALIKTDQNKPI